jgi:hypothetical protein
MFEIQLHAANGTDSYQIREQLKAQGQKELGNGCFGSVWGSEGTDYVTKVTFGNDWGYLRYLEMIQAAPHNPYFPRIHHVDVYLDAEGDTMMVIKMERLDCRWGAWGGSDDDHYEQYRNQAAEIKNQSYGCEEYAWIREDADLQQALDLIEQAHKSIGCSKDLHAGNFMMRGRYQLVITDPLGFPES